MDIHRVEHNVGDEGDEEPSLRKSRQERQKYWGICNSVVEVVKARKDNIIYSRNSEYSVERRFEVKLRRIRKDQFQQSTVQNVRRDNINQRNQDPDVRYSRIAGNQRHIGKVKF